MSTPPAHDERTPLLVESSFEDANGAVTNSTLTQDPQDAVYDRFSGRRKIVILLLITWSGLISPFVGGSIVSLIPQIAHELGTSEALVSLTISISVFAASVGSLAGASYSTFYGRRPIYITVLPLLFIGSFGVALSPNIYWLFFWRFIQALGSSPGISVGAGIIGDIYRLEQRGTAMGMYFGGILLGPALAPFITGLVARYYDWRRMQYMIGWSAAVVYVGMCFILPETSHPGKRGIDTWKAERALGPEMRPGFIWVNPLRSLELLKSPHLVLLSLASAALIMTEFTLITPLTYTIAPAYGIKDLALIGLCFSPIGVGNFVGSPIAGWWSDRVVAKYKAKRGGIHHPEDRLRGTLLGAAVLAPLSVLASGMLTQFTANGKVGWSFWANMLCYFINGFGVDLVFSPTIAYGVDIMHARSAESMAANTALRNLLMAIGIAAVNPLISTIGPAATNAIAAAIAWLGFAMLWCLIRYGEQMRKWSSVDVMTDQALGG